MDNPDVISIFWEEANAAIEEGLLTLKEVKTICQPGRKMRYWGRHLRNLREIIEERRKNNNAESRDTGISDGGDHSGAHGDTSR